MHILFAICTWYDVFVYERVNRLMDWWILWTVCTVTWWNITNVQSYGPTRRWDITSARACVDYCARTTNCVAVDIDYRHSPVQCWVYTEAWRLGYTVSRYNVVQHRVLSRNCRQGISSSVTVRSGQIVGERAGTAFPFRFWRGTQFP